MPTLIGTITAVTGEAVNPAKVLEAYVRAPLQRGSLGSDGRLVTTIPVPVPVSGEVSIDLEPGPAVLVVRTFEAQDVYELYVTADMTLLTEAVAEAAPEHERSWVESQMVQLRGETVAAAGDAVAAAGDAEAAALAAETDRAHVDSIRDQLDEAAQTNVAPYLTETALNATYGTKAEVAQVESDLDAAKVDKSEAAASLAAASALAPATRTKPPAPKRIVTTFEPGHTWTIGNGGTGSTTASTDRPLMGSQAAKLVGQTGGQSMHLTGYQTPGAPVIDMTGKAFLVWLRVDDVSRLGGIMLRAGSNVSTSFFEFRVSGGNSPMSINPGGPDWLPFMVPWAPVQTVGTPDRTAVNGIQIFVTQNGPVPAWSSTSAASPSLTSLPDTRPAWCPSVSMMARTLSTRRPVRSSLDTESAPPCS